MGTRGLAGCTVRAVADASPLTKSAVHYYFETIEEIIDAAMAGLLADFLDHLRTANSTHTNARARLTAVIEQYLGAFATQPGYATLWLGYFSRPAAWLTRRAVRLSVRKTRFPSAACTSHCAQRDASPALLLRGERSLGRDRLRPEIRHERDRRRRWRRAGRRALLAPRSVSLVERLSNARQRLKQAHRVRPGLSGSKRRQADKTSTKRRPAEAQLVAARVPVDSPCGRH